MRSLFTIIAAVIICFSLFQNSSRSHAQRRELSVSRVDTIGLFENVQLKGKVEDSGQVQISSEGFSTIKKLLAGIGDSVLPGQALAEIETIPSPQSQISAVHPEVRQALEELGSLELPEEASNAISGILASAELSPDAAAVAEARLDTLYSPLGGIVTSSPFQEGQSVSPGVPFMTVSDMKTLKIRLPVPEKLIPRLAVGQKCNITSAASGNGTVYPGKIAAIMPTARQITSLTGPSETVVDVVCDVLSTGGRLLPGATADVCVFTSGRRELCLIPYSAIIQGDDNREAIYIVSGGVIKKRRIVTGYELEDKTTVLSGLKKGDIIVLSPGENIREGMRVAMEGTDEDR